MDKDEVDIMLLIMVLLDIIEEDELDQAFVSALPSKQLKP